MLLAKQQARGPMPSLLSNVYRPTANACTFFMNTGVSLWPVGGSLKQMKQKQLATNKDVLACMQFILLWVLRESYHPHSLTADNRTNRHESRLAGIWLRGDC